MARRGERDLEAAFACARPTRRSVCGRYRAPAAHERRRRAPRRADSPRRGCRVARAARPRCRDRPARRAKAARRRARRTDRAARTSSRRQAPLARADDRLDARNARARHRGDSLATLVLVRSACRATRVRHACTLRWPSIGHDAIEARAHHAERAARRARYCRRAERAHARREQRRGHRVAGARGHRRAVDDDRHDRPVVRQPREHGSDSRRTPRIRAEARRHESPARARSACTAASVTPLWHVDDPCAGRLARLRVDREIHRATSRAAPTTRAPRVHREAPETRARHAPPSPPSRPCRATVSNPASCCASPISTVPSSVWRIVSSGDIEKARHALGHEDLPLVRRHRRREPDHRREARVAEAGGEHDTIARDGAARRVQHETVRARARCDRPRGPAAATPPAARNARVQCAQEPQRIAVAVERAPRAARDVADRARSSIAPPARSRISTS